MYTYLTITMIVYNIRYTGLRAECASMTSANVQVHVFVNSCVHAHVCAYRINSVYVNAHNMYIYLCDPVYINK